MIKAIVSDFSKVVLLVKDKSYSGGLNALHKILSAQGAYDFLSHFELNRELLRFYRTLSGSIGIYLFTAEYIQEHPAVQAEIAGIFKDIFSAARLGVRKNAPEAYTVIAKTIDLQPQEILYIDDKQENGAAAQSSGMVTIQYESNDQTIDAIKKKVMFYQDNT